MAGETRRQRRDARRAASDEPARSGRPAPVPAGPAPAAPAVEHQSRRGGFVRESVAELKRVQWPDRETLIQASAITLVFITIMAAYLGVLDAVFNWLVQRIL